MAISSTESDGHLSEAARRLYAACANRDLVEYVAILAEHPTAEAELLRWGLIAPDQEVGGIPAVRDPKAALDRILAAELATARDRVARMAALPDLTVELAQHYQAVQLRAPGGASVYLDDSDVANARIQDVVGSARREILAAQPGGPRSPELLGIAVQRDTAALDRGVELRTIYRDTVRDHPVTAEYARTMSTRTGGRPAQYRTLPGAFERMIIVDREQAFVSNHIVAGAPQHAAWLITDPAAVAVLARVFDSTWMRARPWMGQLRARRGDARDTIGSSGSGMEGVRTTRRQREIMRNLCTGVPQASIARRIGVSERTMEKEVAGLKRLWGVSTMNELIYHWAQSVDNKVDDSAPAAGPAGAEYETTA